MDQAYFWVLLKYQERIFNLNSFVVAAASRKALVADDQSIFWPEESRQHDEYVGDKMLTRAITADQPSVWDLI